MIQVLQCKVRSLGISKRPRKFLIGIFLRHAEQGWCYVEQDARLVVVAFSGALVWIQLTLAVRA